MSYPFVLLAVLGAALVLFTAWKMLQLPNIVEAFLKVGWDGFSLWTKLGVGTGSTPTAKSPAVSEAQETSPPAV